MSFTPLPPSPRKLRLWRIFFALPARNGPLPAELKFRENTVFVSQLLPAFCAVSCMVKIDFKASEIKLESSQAYLLKLQKNL